MTDKARILAQNIRNGSGNHGLSEEQLYQVFSHSNNIVDFAYTLRKCVEHSGASAFSAEPSIIVRPTFTEFTEWHHIDEEHNNSWGFDKKQPGCYIYGVFDTKPTGPADFLGPGVIYIGESRAITRNCMLGRRTDFKGTVRNDRLSPYGCGTAFKQHIGAEKIDQTYQAYLTMHSSLCKIIEMELLVEFYNKYQHVPVCNPVQDLNRVTKFLKENKK